jgi:hypothetical protein
METNIENNTAPSVDVPRLVRKSSYVVMKAIQGWRDIHCVCEDRKTAKAECDLRNAKAVSNRYFVKCVPFVANATGEARADNATLNQNQTL